MKQKDLRSINVLLELDRLGVRYEEAGEDNVKVKCPFHDDSTPSCSVNVEQGVFRCHSSGCRQTGDILTFMARTLRRTRAEVFAEVSTRYEIGTTRVIAPSTVERHHEAIWSSKRALRELHERGVTDDLIRKYRIGLCRSRITIPIKNEAGHFVNVRRYLPGGRGDQKMRNTRGHGQMRLFPVEQLRYDEVVVCGGELKAIVMAAALNDHGIGAVTTTGGEGSWHPDFTKLFKGKVTYVCFDVDDEGMQATDRLCSMLSSSLDVRVVTLPLDRDEHPHGDVNDWVGREGAEPEEVLSVVRSSPAWQGPDEEEVPDADPIDVSLSSATDATNVGKRVHLTAMVSAVDVTPYAVPRRVTIDCDKNQPGCSHCPIYAKDYGDEVPSEEVSPESPSILDMVNAPKRAQARAIANGLRIPACKSVKFKVKSYYNVEDVRLSPHLGLTNGEASRGSSMQPAMVVGRGLELNESYEMTGRMFPSPKTQQTVVLVSKTKPIRDALSSYSPDRSQLARLESFNPTGWTLNALNEKLDELYSDLEANVTRIYMRRPMHLMMDLAWHSPLAMRVEDRLVKGWVEVVVVGDSSQGKTETATNLARHYGCGERVDCKNASTAGLIGGCQQLGNRWFVTWGAIPTQDRRLVILEELKGAGVEVISKLTDMRSSGVAEIPKIEKRKTNSRTRLIALSNPRSGHPMNTYSFGVEALTELIGSAEDVRRFDAALIVASSEVRVDELYRMQRDRPDVPHVHTSEMCRSVVLWAWTRTDDQVLFTDDARDAVVEESIKLCSRFTDEVPLVDRGSMSHKLARLSASLAARTFSHQDLESVLVRPCHVARVVELLVDAYTRPTFGYDRYSDAVQSSTRLIEPLMIKDRVLQTPFPTDFVTQMLHANDVEMRDICDWCGWERGDALKMLSFLVRKHALRRVGRTYRKTPEFIALLKDLDPRDRPRWIGEDDEM